MTAVRRPARLEGVLELPGDKSVSHRALILNSIATGEAQVENLSPGADVVSTLAARKRLPREGFRFALGMAAASTAVATAAAAALGSRS